MRLFSSQWKSMVAGAGGIGIGIGIGIGNKSIDILPRTGLVIRSRRHHVSKLPQTAIGRDCVKTHVSNFVYVI